MVSVAIIAIAFTSLLVSQSQSISIATESRFMITASLLAQKKLAELELSNFEELSSAEGDFGEDYPGFFWETEIQNLSEDETGVNFTNDMLKLIDVKVRLEGSGFPKYIVRSIVMQKIEAATQ